MNKRHGIIVYGIMIVPIMISLMYVLTHYLGKTKGYVMGYGIYLSLAFIGFFVFSDIKQSRKLAKKKNTNKYELIYYLLAFIPVIATFFVAFLPEAKNYSIAILLITAGYAIANGTIEELFWRYTYFNVFNEKWLLSCIIPTINFTCWHVALLFAKGMSYHGGAPALVGGAGMMGCFWTLMMYKTRNIKVAILAHIGANFCAFSMLIYQNWFM